MSGIIIYFLLLPLIDFLSLLNPSFFIINGVIKGIFLLYIIFFLLKNTPYKKILILLLSFFIIYLFYSLYKDISIYRQMNNLYMIFSLPIFILYMKESSRELLNKKIIMIIGIISNILGILGCILSISLTNLLPIYFILFCLGLFYFKENKNILLISIYCLLYITLLILLKNSILIIFSLYALLGFILYANKKLLFLSLSLLSLIIINYKVDFNELKNDLFIKNVNIVKTSEEEFINSSLLEKTFGLKNNCETPVDIYNIIYTVGILGTIVYLLFFFYVLNKCYLKKKYLFFFYVVIILSNFFNILVSSYIGIYLALVFILNKNDLVPLKKNILLVSNMYPNDKNPHYGIFVKNTYDSLKENNYSIDKVVITKTNGKINKLRAYLRFYMVSFFKSLLNQYDYIYVHFASHSTIGVFIPCLFNKETKLVLNTHGNDIVADNKRDKLNIKLSKIFLKHADKVIASSLYFKTVLVNDYKITEDKIVVYPAGGIDFKLFKKKNKNKVIASLGLEKGKHYIGFVSRLEEDKGYDVYLKFISEVVKYREFKDYKYILIGSGSKEEEVNQYILDNNLENFIVRDSLVSQEKLVDYYNAMDIFVYPTRRKSESLGLTGLEVMACKTLIVGSNKYGPSSYLVDNENSLTFNPEDYLELVEKVKKCINMTTKEKNKLINNAYKTSLTYDKDKIKNILLDVFKK